MRSIPKTQSGNSREKHQSVPQIPKSQNQPTQGVAPKTPRFTAFFLERPKRTFTPEFVKVHDEIELQESLLNQKKNIVSGDVATPPPASVRIIDLTPICLQDDIVHMH